MAQKSEAVFVVERSRILIARSNNEHTLSAWEPVRVADDRADARSYATRQNALSKRFRYRVYPRRVTKL